MMAFVRYISGLFLADVTSIFAACADAQALRSVERKTNLPNRSMVSPLKPFPLQTSWAVGPQCYDEFVQGCSPKRLRHLPEVLDSIFRKVLTVSCRAPPRRFVRSILAFCCLCSADMHPD